MVARPLTTFPLRKMSHDAIFFQFPPSCLVGLIMLFRGFSKAGAPQG